MLQALKFKPHVFRTLNGKLLGEKMMGDHRKTTPKTTENLLLNFIELFD